MDHVTAEEIVEAIEHANVVTRTDDEYVLARLQHPGRRAAVPRQNLCFFKVHVHRIRPGGTGIAVTPDFGGSLLRECRRDGRVHELAIDRPQAHVMVEYPLALGHNFAEVNLWEGSQEIGNTAVA